MSQLLQTLIPYLFPLVLAGCLAGFIAGLFGIGGGLVIVPTLFFLFQNMGIEKELAMTLAVSTSLASIIPTAISSSFSHYKLNNIDWLLVKRWSPALIIGVLLGAYTVTVVNGRFLIFFFGSFLIFMACRTWIFSHDGSEKQMPHLSLQAITSLFVGLSASMAGVGGGALSVPLMRWMGVNVHRAIGSSAVLGLVVALVACLVILLFGKSIIDSPTGTYGLFFVPALILLMPFCVGFAPVGARLGKRLAPQLLSRLFAVALLLMGGRMIFSGYTY